MPWVTAIDKLQYLYRLTTPYCILTSYWGWILSFRLMSFTPSRVVTVIGVGQSLRFFTFLWIVPLRFISASALQSFPVDLIQTHHIKGMIYRTHVWVIKTGTFCNYVRIAETGKKTNTHKTVSVNHVSGIVFPKLTQYT